MTCDKWVTVWCDAEGCHEHYEPGEQYVKDAREKAQQRGWTHRNGNDYCPEHSEESS